MKLTKSKPSLLSIINSILLLGFIIFFIFSNLEDKNPQIVYLDNVAVFSGFNLAKDLNKLHQKELIHQKKKVDSLVGLLQADSKEEPMETQQRQFVFENNKLKEMGEYFQNEVSQQVWNRVNDYIQQYGKQNNYKIILGTQGNGNIMYGDKEVNITEAFIEYANKIYEGE